MVYCKSDLEMAQRHVAQGERHIASQERIISVLCLHGAPLELAEQLLSDFNKTLELHRTHLAQIEAELEKSRGCK
jgi:hypothetical protein